MLAFFMRGLTPHGPLPILVTTLLCAATIMKLIASLTSPYARKVRIVLLEKKLDCPLELDIPWEADSKVAQANPLGKVPVLVMDDGNNLFDSRVIAEYLDSISPVSRLFPQDRHLLLEARRWEALADGICDAAANMVIEQRRPAQQQSPEWIARQQDKVMRGTATLSDWLGSRQWCCGDSYSIADICTVCALAYLDFRLPQFNWRESYPNLAQWFYRLEQRPSIQETQPPH